MYRRRHEEFLVGTGEAPLAELLHSGDFVMINAFASKLEDQLRTHVYKIITDNEVSGENIRKAQEHEVPLVIA